MTDLLARPLSQQPREGTTLDALGIIAHEMAQPLSIINAYAENFRALASRGRVADMAEIADAIHRNTVVAADLLRSLTDVDALERDSLRLAPAPRSLVAAVREVIGDLDATVPVPIALTSGDDVLADLDITRFRQILSNLVANAVKFSPAGSTVSIDVRSTGDGSHGEVSVIDRGPGVPPEREGELFTRFGKLGTHQGTGLGLYVSRRLARLHGGDITYRRAATGGAQFILRMPASGSSPLLRDHDQRGGVAR